MINRRQQKSETRPISVQCLRAQGNLFKEQNLALHVDAADSFVSSEADEMSDDQ